MSGRTYVYLPTFLYAGGLLWLKNLPQFVIAVFYNLIEDAKKTFLRLFDAVIGGV